MNIFFKKYFLSPIVIALLGLMVAYANFTHDTFRSADKNWWQDFNIDSEIHILGKIVADRFNMPITDNQGFFAVDAPTKQYDYNIFWQDMARNRAVIYNDLFTPKGLESMTKDEAEKRIVMGYGEYMTGAGYASQYVLQGKIYSYLFNNLGITDLKTFYAINGLLLAIIIVGLSFLFWRAIDKPFAVIFYLSMVFSPWVVVFAKNLYWTTWADVFARDVWLALLFGKTPPVARLVVVDSIIFVIHLALADAL